MTHTIETIKAWLSDDSQFYVKYPSLRPENGLDFAGVRKRFPLKTGGAICIQQSALHYCDASSLELDFCSSSPLLEPYSTQGTIYENVPFEVVVAYLNEQENI